MRQTHPGDAYILRRRIGSGGMGVVYEAWDARLERRVALKVLHPHLLTDEKSAARLEREARLAARVEHPNVVQIHRIDWVDGQLAIDMQYVEGAPLHELLHGGPMPVAEAVRLLHQLLTALAACHAQGVLHLDIKPGNLLVTAEGHVYLSDFGIARAAYENQAATGLDSGPLWGTPRYSPPEAWRGEPPTAKWDLYAVGVVIREVLVDKAVFAAPTPEMLMRQKLDGTPEDMASLRPELSPELSGLLNRLVAPDPAARPEHAVAALALLESSPECLNREEVTQDLRYRPLPRPTADVQPTPLSALGAQHAAKAAQGRWRSVVTMLVVLFLGVLGGGWYFRGALSGAREVAPVSSGAITDLTLTEYAAFFTYDDGEHGREPWMYLNAPPRFEMVGDIAPGRASSDPRRLKSFLSKVYFAATSPDRGEELWVMDVAAEGHPALRFVRDVIPGAMGSEPEPISSHDNIVLFYATTMKQGRELWCTNGREAQTGLVQDLAPGMANSEPMNPRWFQSGDTVYFIAYGGEGLKMRLWHYSFADNSVASIAVVDDEAAGMAMVGGVLLFANRDEAHGREIWMYDSSQKAVKMLTDLWPGRDGSNPGQFYLWKDRLLFQARSLAAGLELWSTDGTALGTYQLADINPGQADSDPYDFVGVGDLVYFRAKDAAHGNELWVTNGEAGGTRLAADVWPGPESSTPYNLTTNGNLLLFSANDGEHGEELWMIDGAQENAPARMVADLLPGEASSEPHNLKWWSATDGLVIVKESPAKERLCKVSVNFKGVELAPLTMPGAAERPEVSRP